MIIKLHKERGNKKHKRYLTINWVSEIVCILSPAREEKKKGSDEITPPHKGVVLYVQ